MAPTSPSPSASPVTSDRDLLACLLDSIPDRVYFKDEHGRFLRVSHAEARFLGAQSTDEVIGKTDFDYFAPELARDAFLDEQKVMSTGEAVTGKVERKQFLDGRKGWALVAKIPLRNSAGQLIGTCGISKDITALKETQMALHEANVSLAQHQERLEIALADAHAAHESLKAAQQRLIELENVRWITRLAFGVAHEIRNPLGVLHMALQFFDDRNTTGEPEESQIIQLMREAIDRANMVISALMDGALASGISLQPAEIAATVQEAVEMMRHRQEQDQPSAGPSRPPVPLTDDSAA